MTAPSTLKNIGFGTYRIDDRHPPFLAALQLALENGCEWIDTSTNYGFGSSEIAVGKVLAAWKGSRPKVVSKAGYIQGPLLKEAARFPEVTTLGPDLAHCIHPEFIREMIRRSRERLGGAVIESYLLHNPEYFLKKTGDHREYYSRIEKAFRALEEAVAAGEIRSYGVSSNTLIEDREHPEFTSLEVLLDIRDRIESDLGRPSHFKVLQFPFNLFEAEAALASQHGGLSVLELASKAGLTTLANRPLNAFTRKHLVRLASFRNHHQVDFRHLLSKIFDDVNGLETRFPAAAGTRPIFWGHLLRENFKDLIDLEQWRNFLNWRIRPSLMDLEASVSRTDAGRDWWKEYEPRLEGLLQTVDAYMENGVAERSERLRVRLIEAAPALRSSRTLSQAALRISLSVPGLDCVLLGMRSAAYVEDAIAAAKEPLLTAEEAFAALGAAQEFLAEFEDSESETTEGAHS